MRHFFLFFRIIKKTVSTFIHVNLGRFYNIYFLHAGIILDTSFGNVLKSERSEQLQVCTGFFNKTFFNFLNTKKVPLLAIINF